MRRLFHEGVEDESLAAHGIGLRRGNRLPARLRRVACHRIDGPDLQRDDLAGGNARRRFKVTTPAAASQRQRGKRETQKPDSAAKTRGHTKAPLPNALIDEG
jgi:hypothetical protein